MSKVFFFEQLGEKRGGSREEEEKLVLSFLKKKGRKAKREERKRSLAMLSVKGKGRETVVFFWCFVSHCKQFESSHFLCVLAIVLDV